MDISRRTDYALRMIAALVHDPSGVVSVRSAARDAHVPYSFARSIQHDLGVAGIVENSRGASGGMRLSADPRTTTLLQLIEAVQGPVVISECLVAQTGEPCPNRAGCRFASVWCGAELMMRRLFSSVTLHELVVEGLSPVFEGTFSLVPEARARELYGFDVPGKERRAGEKGEGTAGSDVPAAGSDAPGAAPAAGSDAPGAAPAADPAAPDPDPAPAADPAAPAAGGPA